MTEDRYAVLVFAQPLHARAHGLAVSAATPEPRPRTVQAAALVGLLRR